MNNLELSDEEQKILIKALDLYSRILCGQIKEIERLYRYGEIVKCDNVNLNNAKVIETKLNEIKSLIWPQLTENSSFAILHPDTPKKAQIAYKLLLSIKNDKDTIMLDLITKALKNK